MTDTTTIDVLCQRMIEDMTARKLGPASQKSRLRAYKRFAAWLQRSPDTATADDIRLFQLHLAETGVGTVTRNATMTGLRFLFRVTLRRHDLAFEIYHIKEPQSACWRWPTRAWGACGSPRNNGHAGDACHPPCLIVRGPRSKQVAPAILRLPAHAAAGLWCTRPKSCPWQDHQGARSGSGRYLSARDCNGG
jgi:hypothetical protein